MEYSLLLFGVATFYILLRTGSALSTQVMRIRYLSDYMKLDIPVKKEIHKCHSDHQKPFTLIHRLCTHRKPG